VKLTEHLPADRRSHVDARLHGNLMAWLTTVRPDGRPVSVPVWFLLRDDETFLIYSKPSTVKLRNLQDNPNVALGLDVTDLGRDVIRLEGTAEYVEKIAPADQNRQYVAKYIERIGAIFGTAEKFAEQYSVPVVITPTRMWA
jgi:PPOX class probable F420-dependent enzyme